MDFELSTKLVEWSTISWFHKCNQLHVFLNIDDFSNKIIDIGGDFYWWNHKSEFKTKIKSVDESTATNDDVSANTNEPTISK